MASIVEFEIFCFFPFSNWPDFDQKLSKIGKFVPQIAQNQGFLNFFFAKLCPLFPNFVFKVISDSPEHKS